MPRKQVLLVDDNYGVRALVRQLFDLEADFEICGEAGNGLEAVEKASSLKPDLIIMDLTMPVMTGLDAAGLLLKRLPEAKIILFTVHEGAELERLATESGIHAVVSKNQAVSKLVQQSRDVLTKVQNVEGPDKLRSAG
jgi:two-component system nitrate/nitrite response regulator NarL